MARMVSSTISLIIIVKMKYPIFYEVTMADEEKVAT